MKQLKKNLFLVLSLLTLLSSTSALASGVSGGGAEIVRNFVKKSWAVINRIDSLDQSIISIQQLERTMKSLDVVVRPILLDPKTGEAIPDQKYLYAYGSPGLIQLKPIWAEYFEQNLHLDQDVAHELFRASGVYNDNGYRISISELRLDIPSGYEVPDQLHSFKFNEVSYDSATECVNDSVVISYFSSEDIGLELYCLYRDNNIYLTGSLTILNGEPPYRRGRSKSKKLKVFYTQSVFYESKAGRKFL